MYPADHDHQLKLYCLIGNFRRAGRRYKSPILGISRRPNARYLGMFERTVPEHLDVHDTRRDVK